MITTMVPIYYVNPNKIIQIITNKQHPMLSSRGIVYQDGDELLLSDQMSNLTRIKKVIRLFDKPTYQVLIKAQIIHIDSNYAKTLGLTYSTQTNLKKDGHSLIFEFPPEVSANGHFQLPIINLGNSSILNIQLSALEEAGHAKLLSSPELITINNKPAIIESGEEIPYQQATLSGATSVNFKKAVLRLQVTPKVFPNNTILLKLKINQDKVSTLTINGVPAISTQQMETQLLVRNKQTILLGGILEQTQSKQQQGLPILSKIPVIGGLFRKDDVVNQKRELVVVITPTIIR